MDELKPLLDDNKIDYSETELVINEDGVEDGPPNSTIENLGNIFVSLTLFPPTISLHKHAEKHVPLYTIIHKV